jgi:hypothetical protein
MKRKVGDFIIDEDTIFIDTKDDDFRKVATGEKKKELEKCSPSCSDCGYRCFKKVFIIMSILIIMVAFVFCFLIKCSQ